MDWLVTTEKKDVYSATEDIAMWYVVTVLSSLPEEKLEI